MGLLNMFKKVPRTHEEKLNNAYLCYNKDMVSMIFPGKKQQANKIVISLAKILDLNLEFCDVKKYHEILLIYSDICIRKNITGSSDDLIVKSLQVKHGDMIVSKNIAYTVLTYFLLSMNNNDYIIESEEDLKNVEELANSFAENEEIVKENYLRQEDNIEDLEYGLVPTKPIYVKGVSGSKEYLDILRTSQGKQLHWNRKGSISINSIEGMIDVYEGMLTSGEIYQTLYLNMYAPNNSTKAPEGFNIL